MSENKYVVKEPNMHIREIPRAAALVFKKYGIKTFIFKSINYIVLKLGLSSVQKKSNKYDVKDPDMHITEIPHAAVLVFKKYGIKTFVFKTINFIILKVGLSSVQKASINKGHKNAMDLYYERFRNTQPIKYIRVERASLRINVVTDSIKKGSLFGGVATALILATEFANTYDIPLRIITREAHSTPNDFENFIKFMNRNIPAQIEYFSDYDRNISRRGSRLEISDKDIYLSTSWWTTIVTEKINLRKNFFYILQEIETFFYPSGDEQIICATTLEKTNVKYIINSKLLHEYYRENNYENVVKNSVYFEPAFQEHIYFRSISAGKKEKYRLLFYARPNNSRNLFYTGIKLLNDAIVSGIIKKDEWDIYFAGSETEKIVFFDDIKPIFLGQMDWKQYADFIKTVDLGLCLMSTPHPSYPPLDIVASGGVVLTNKFLNKKELQYSKNIICADLNEKEMLEGFISAVSLAKDTKRREMNFYQNKIEKEWSRSFKDVLMYMHEHK